MGQQLLAQITCILSQGTPGVSAQNTLKHTQGEVEGEDAGPWSLLCWAAQEKFVCYPQSPVSVGTSTNRGLCTSLLYWFLVPVRIGWDTWTPGHSPELRNH